MLSNRKKKIVNRKRPNNVAKFFEESAFCPGIKKFLKSDEYDIIILSGYATLTSIYANFYLKRKKDEHCSPLRFLHLNQIKPLFTADVVIGPYVVIINYR